MTNLNITLHRGQTETLQAQLIRQLKSQIVRHQIGANQRLPSSRALARDLQVSRIITLAAYEQLAAEGYLVTRPGSGTYSTENIPHASTAKSPTLSHEYTGPNWFTSSASFPSAPSPSGPTAEIDFSLGRPALTPFDAVAWKRSWRQALAQPFHNRPPPPEGIKPLRQALADHVARNRGIRCQAEDIIITTGAADVITLLARVTAPFQPLSCLENPGFPAAVQSFKRYGHEICAIGIDEQGLRASDLPETPNRPKLLFCTPSHQFPLGFRLSLNRRHQVMAWARRHDALILEDDYDSEFRYDVAPLPPLKELDDTGHVLYFSSLSKSLSPAIRLGYMIAPAKIRQAVTQEIDQNHMQPPWLVQQAMANFIQSGELDKHIRRMRRHYATLQDTLKMGLSVLPDAVNLYGLEAGLHCFMHMPPHDTEKFEQTLHQKSIKMIALDRYKHAPTAWHGYALGYSHMATSEITRGSAGIAEAVQDVLC